MQGIEVKEKKTPYVCGLCGYIYDPVKGDKKGKIPPQVAFDELPEDWRCPLCGAPKSRFSPMLE